MHVYNVYSVYSVHLVYFYYYVYLVYLVYFVYYVYLVFSVYSVYYLSLNFRAWPVRFSRLELVTLSLEVEPFLPCHFISFFVSLLPTVRSVPPATGRPV
jgi:hypothetical protein